MALANSVRGNRRKRRHHSLTRGLGVLGGCVAFAGLLSEFAKRRGAVDSRQEDEPIMQHNYQVAVGDHVYLEDGGEEIGAVRKIERDHLVVYVEAAGDFVVRGPEVKAIHYGKVVLEADKVDPRLLEAARSAHERETD
jgi:hypothetical protein